MATLLFAPVTSKLLVFNSGDKDIGSITCKVARIILALFMSSIWCNSDYKPLVINYERSMIISAVIPLRWQILTRTFLIMLRIMFPSSLYQKNGFGASPGVTNLQSRNLKQS